MNRQTAEKVKFFMDAMAGRVAGPENISEGGEDNNGEDRFTGEITVTFRSGLKKFGFSAMTGSGGAGKYSFNYSGNTYVLDYAGLTALVCREIPDYDELTVVFPGETRDSIISAKDKNDFYKTADKSA